MWRHYLRAGWASLARSKAYSLINLAGLSLGLAASLIILLHVRYELSYDGWLPEADRAFVLQQWVTGSDDPNVIPGTNPMTSYVSGERLRQFPQLDRIVYVGNAQPVILQNGEATTSEDFVFVNGPLFDILQLDFRRGDRATALASAGLAGAHRKRGDPPVRYPGCDQPDADPGDRRPAGRLSRHRDRPGCAPQQPSRAFDRRAGRSRAALRGGQSVPHPVDAEERLGLCAPAARRRCRRDRPPDAGLGTAQHSRPDAGRRAHAIPGTNADWRLANVRDVHLGEADGGGMRPGNDRATVAAMALIGLLILAMAVVNFVNLATARAGQRAREVALRKVLGASRRQLIAQFLGEAMLLAAAAMLIALALAEAALPFVNAFLDADMKLTWWGLDGVLLPSLLLILARRRPRRALSRALPLPLPAGAGAQGKPLVRRGRGLGAAAQRPRRRPVRRVDRADHLHRDHPGADRLCPQCRPGLSPRRHPPDRPDLPQRPPAAARDADARDRGRRRNRLDRPLDHRRRHLGHGEHDGDRARGERERRIRALPGRSRLLPDARHRSRRRPHLRRRRGDGRQHARSGGRGRVLPWRGAATMSC